MKKKIIWVGVSCLMMVALLLVSCAPSVTEKEVAPPAEEAPAAKLLLSIGETGQSDKLAVTVLEAIVTDSYQYISPTSGETVTKEAAPDKSFFIVTAVIKSISDSTQITGGSWLELHDSEGVRYAAMPYPGEDGITFDKHLPEKQEIRGKVLFQIRKGASGLKVGYPGLADWEIK